MKKILEAKQLKKIYGDKKNQYIALDGVDLDIEEGDFVGVMGPSGAGKSTLLNIVSTIDKATSGSIKVGGKEITALNNKALAKFRRENLGFIFQDFNLLDTLTVRENIALPLALANVPKITIEAKVKNIVRILNINDILDKYPYEISGGQKQRTAASRAIIGKPSLILADEPTGALDSKSSKDLLESIKRLNEEENATIMMVTHDALSASYCKKVMFIKDGRVYDTIERKSDRKKFFKDIMEVLGKIGGSEDAII